MKLKVILLAVLILSLLATGTALAQDATEEIIVEVPVESVIETTIDENDLAADAEITAPDPVDVDADSIGTDVESAEDRNQTFWQLFDEKGFLEIWALGLGWIVMPPLIKIFQKYGWGERQINLLALILSAIFTVAGAFARGEFDNGAYLATTFASILGATQIAYQKFWKAWGMDQFMTWLGKKTEWGKPAGVG